MLTLMSLCSFPYSITINKCKGSCNTIDPYAKLCVLTLLKT